jgi:DNA-binding HxlR family transcriptional regulator
MTSKWKFFILCILEEEPRHFGELLRAVTGISKKVLTENLRDLEKEALISRRSYKVNTIEHTEYKLTKKGMDYCAFINDLNDWGASYLKQNRASALS